MEVKKHRLRGIPFVLAAVGWIAVVGLAAQEAAPERPQFPDPLIARAPEKSQWTIDVRANRSGQDQGQGGASTAVQKYEFYKDGETYRRVTHYRGEGTTETWIFHGIQVQQQKRSRNWVAMLGFFTETLDISKSDFPGLGLVRSDHFTGVDEYNGRPVFVFSYTFDPGELSAWERERLAEVQREYPGVTARIMYGEQYPDFTLYLDAATWLPLYYETEAEVHTYTYEQPTFGELVPPRGALEAMAERQAHQEEVLRPPTGHEN